MYFISVPLQTCKIFSTNAYIHALRPTSDESTAKSCYNLGSFDFIYLWLIDWLIVRGFVSTSF